MRNIALLTAAVALLMSISAPVQGAQKIKLELVAGPQMTMLTRKGVMSRVLNVKSMEEDRAHQLKFTFHPAIQDKSLKVKLYRGDAGDSRELLLGGGRKIVIDIDPGPTSLQIMVEEQGLLKEETRVFTSLYRYPANFKLTSGNKPKSMAKPKMLVEKSDLNRELKGRRLRRVLKKLGLQQKEAEAFTLDMANARAYVTKTNIGAALYFLKEAQKKYNCAEVDFWRAFAYSLIDFDKTESHLDKAFTKLKEGKSCAELLGMTLNKSLARTHSLAANVILRKAVSVQDLSKIQLFKMRRTMEKHLAEIKKLDPKDSKTANEVIRRNWAKMMEARKNIKSRPSQAPKQSSQLAENVKNFLEARKLYVSKSYGKSLAILEKTENLPEADALYLRAENLLQMGRREGAKKALEKSIRAFDNGRCLAGVKGGNVPGAQGVVPPATFRAALARVSLARYWGERFKREQQNGADGKKIVSYLENAIKLVEEALQVLPSNTVWQRTVNLYRDERLKILYPKFNKKS